MYKDWHAIFNQQQCTMDIYYDKNRITDAVHLLVTKYQNKTLYQQIQKEHLPASMIKTVSSVLKLCK